MDEVETVSPEAGVPQWTLADRLRKSLQHAAVEPAEMSEYLEVHRNTVSNWIHGHARPPASAVKLWAMRCGVPYEWVMSGTVTDSGAVSPHSSHRPTIICEPDRQPSTAEIAALTKRIPLTRPAHAISAERGMA